MREVGAFEAKTHLSELLGVVEAGETVTITQRAKVLSAWSRLTTHYWKRRMRH